VINHPFYDLLQNYKNEFNRLPDFINRYDYYITVSD
jgi:hypothetical protein